MSSRQWKFIGGMALAVAITTGIIVATQEQQAAIIDTLLGFLR